MPFTFSHPAAVLPAKWLPEKWVSMTALVIGSVTPDFEYFIRMRNLSKYSHLWTGLLWYDLPIAFLLAYIYHRFIRDGLIDNLPRILRKRLSRFKDFDWLHYVGQHFWVVTICFIIGIASHIAWDGFTHRTGYFVERIPWFAGNTYMFGIGYTRFYVLQQISSVLGMAFIIFAVFRIPKDERVEKRSIFKYWMVAICVTILIAATRVLVAFKLEPLIESIKGLINSGFYGIFFDHGSASDIIMTVISAFLLSLIITPYIIRSRA
jgi:hypothetical protein